VKRLFLLFSLAFLAACVATAVVGAMLGKSPRLITGDAIGYYAWLRSISLDRDIEFTNDYRLLYPPDPIPEEFGARTATGLARNKYPPGLAIVEAPGFAAGHLAALISGAPTDGASSPYQFGVVLWLQLVIVTAFVALWLALVRLGANTGISSVLVASGLVATNLVEYAAKETAMAHGAGAALICFAFYAIVRARDSERQSWWLSAVGILVGLALIIRPTSAAFAPFLIVFLLPQLRKSPRNMLAIALPIGLLVLYHVALTSLLTGRVALSAYDGESFTGGLTGMAGTLFSSRHGLFIYNPWYLVMVGCCVVAARRQDIRAIAVGTVASFAILWLANGLWWNWWFGSAFGNRAYIESIPVLIIPVALWLSARVSRRGLTALASGMAVLAALNLYLWLGFLLHRFPPDGLHSVTQAYLWPTQR
jgi:hypothetical protein